MLVAVFSLRFEVILPYHYSIVAFKRSALYSEAPLIIVLLCFSFNDFFATGFRSSIPFPSSNFLALHSPLLPHFKLLQRQAFHIVKIDF